MLDRSDSKHTLVRPKWKRRRMPEAESTPLKWGRYAGTVYVSFKFVKRCVFVCSSSKPVCVYVMMRTRYDVL